MLLSKDCIRLYDRTRFILIVSWPSFLHLITFIIDAATNVLKLRSRRSPFFLQNWLKTFCRRIEKCQLIHFIEKKIRNFSSIYKYRNGSQELRFEYRTEIRVYEKLGNGIQKVNASLVAKTGFEDSVRFFSLSYFVECVIIWMIDEQFIESSQLRIYEI